MKNIITVGPYELPPLLTIINSLSIKNFVIQLVGTF